MHQIERMMEYGRERVKVIKSEAQAHLTEGAKALLAVNGGGVVSMLGFMQAVAKDGGKIHAFMPYGLWAMTIFVIGVVLGVLIYFSGLVRTSKEMADSTYNGQFWRDATFYLWLASLAAFVIGAFVAGFGINRSL